MFIYVSIKYYLGWLTDVCYKKNKYYKFNNKKNLPIITFCKK